MKTSGESGSMVQQLLWKGASTAMVVGAMVWAVWSSCMLRTQAAVAVPCYPAIFVFGDSLSDTGNGNLTGRFTSTRTAQRPYGETFPGFPFARFSDGRLLVDFLAFFTGLPLLNPSQKGSADFSSGVNYAVDGATALDSAFLNSRRIFASTQNSALDVQIARHLKLKATAASAKHHSTRDRTVLPNSKAFANGLYVIIIAGNDYLNALRRQKLYPPSVVNKVILPFIIDKIQNVTEVLYANGARHFLIFGLPPLGCSPSLLASNTMAIKDRYGCLRDINLLSYNHGVKLLAMVESLRAAYLNANFAFADYYGAFNHVLEDKAFYGLTNTLDACCGAGTFFPYRFKFLLFCNRLSSTALTTLCSNPNTFISWDGIHFTDKFNSYIFDLTVASGFYLNPSNAFSHCKQ